MSASTSPTTPTAATLAGASVDPVGVGDTVGDSSTWSRDDPKVDTFVGAVLGSSVAILIVIGAGAQAALVAPALVAAGVVATVDARAGRLPDLGVVAVAVLGVAAAVADTVVAGDSSGPTGWVSGAAIAVAPLLLLHLVAPGAMGFGDVKFAAALGGLLGVAGTDLSDRARLAMLALTIASGAAAVGSLALRRRRVAYGPWLFVGTGTTLVASAFTRSPFA